MEDSEDRELIELIVAAILKLNPEAREEVRVRTQTPTTQTAVVTTVNPYCGLEVFSEKLTGTPQGSYKFTYI
jgi:hypothetical protein